MWIFLTIVLSVVAVILCIYSCTSDGLQGLAGQVYAWCIVAAIFIADENISEPTPTALDVYRGNTELKITSVNGVPTDTVVVFKSTNLNIY